MDERDRDYEQFVQGRQPANPVLLKVFEVMQKNGDLDGLSDEEALEKVVTATELILEDPDDSLPGRRNEEAVESEPAEQEEQV